MRKSAAKGTMLTLVYGTAEIIGYEAPWRIEIYRPFKVHPAEPWNREVRERIMAVDASDASTRHDKMNSYSSECSCCYLNISHTVDLHDLRVSAAKPIDPNAMVHFMAIQSALGDKAFRPQDFTVGEWRLLIARLHKRSIPDVTESVRNKRFSI